ncbi:hypothetical protein GGF32_004728 [Allomyces javanicus]|nr:hypothetical protein GGF32_004728 [Allomyces javanicus]
MEAYTVQYRVKSKKQSKYLDGLMHWWPDVPKAMLIEDKGRRIETFGIPRQVLAPQSEIESRLHYIIIDQPHNAAAQLAVAAAAPPPPPPVPDMATPSSPAASGGLLAPAPATPGPVGVRRIGLSSNRNGAAPRFRTPLLRSLSSIAAPEPPAPTTPRVKFIVLWTDQKQKKHKTWNDGHCVLTENGKLVLYAENDRRLDSLFCKKPPQVGDELEFDFHLVTISEAVGAGHGVTSTAAVAQPAPLPAAARAPGLDVSPAPPPDRIQWPKFSTPLKGAGSGGRDDGGQAVTRADSLGPEQASAETQAAPAPRRVPARHTPSLDARPTSTTEGASTRDTVDDTDRSQSKKLSASAANRKSRRSVAAVEIPEPATPCPNSSSSKTQFRQLPTPSTAEKPPSDGGFSIGRPPRKILRPSSVRSMEELAPALRPPSPPVHLDVDAAQHVVPPPPAPEPRPPTHVPLPRGPDPPMTEYQARTNTSAAVQRPGVAAAPPVPQQSAASHPVSSTVSATGPAVAHAPGFSTRPPVPAPHGPPAGAAGPITPPPAAAASRPPLRTIDTIRRAPARAGASNGGDAESRQIVSFTPKTLKFRALHRKPQRLLKLPDMFPTVQQYRTLFTSAVYESLQAQVASVANDYFRVYNALTNNGKTQVDPDKLEAAVRRKGIALHTGVKMTRAFGSLSLILGSKYGSYGKDDLWVVANTPYFGYATFLRSTFFGVSQLSVDVAPLNSPMNPSQDSLYFAIRLFTCNELSQVANLESFGPQTTPAFPLMLNYAKNAPPPDSVMADFVPEIPEDEYYNIAHRLAVQYSLNEGQTAVLVSWARKLKTQATSVTLVHGVFGSGKSHLVTVLVLFFSKVLARRLAAAAAGGGGASARGNQAPDAVAADYRVLVSSNTNVAVDRILEGLLGKGFSDFVRVGNLKKMSKLVLPHAAANKNQEGLRDLGEQLARATSDRDRDLIRTAMERLGGNHLARARVVGATCLATLLECMDQERFGMVILDECSQMTEPLSLLPLRLGAKHVVCVGDPKQLPPTLESDCPHGDHLEKTIFERLARAGCPVQVLREQYRCHEDISAIANSLFYDGHLINGTHVPNGIANLPTVVFVDVTGTEQRCSRTNSFYNVAEARELVHFYHILTHGPGRNVLPGVPRLHVPASDVGIITLYRGQVEALRGMLKEPGGNALGLAPVRHSSTGGGDDESDSPDLVAVNTVDAFQGSEKRVILVSCVRSANVGFSDDARRINVMLTRARHHLVMFGHRALLSRSPLWAQVLQRCHCVSAREFRGMIPRMVAAHDWHETVVEEDGGESDDDFVTSPRRRRRPVPGPALAPAPAPPRMLRPADPPATSSFSGTKKRHAEDPDDDEGPSLARKRTRESFFMEPTESDSDNERDEPLAAGLPHFSMTNPPRTVLRPTAVKNLETNLLPEDVIMDEAPEMPEVPSATFHDDGFDDEMLLAISTPHEPAPPDAGAAAWDADEWGAAEWDAAAAKWDADPAPRVDAGGDAVMADIGMASPHDLTGLVGPIVEDPIKEARPLDAAPHHATSPPINTASAADAPTNWEVELDSWMQEEVTDPSPAAPTAADPSGGLAWEAEADAWMRDAGNTDDAVAPAVPAAVTSNAEGPGDDTDWDDLERMYAEMGGE